MADPTGKQGASKKRRITEGDPAKQSAKRPRTELSTQPPANAPAAGSLADKSPKVDKLTTSKGEAKARRSALENGNGEKQGAAKQRRKSAGKEDGQRDGALVTADPPSESAVEPWTLSPLSGGRFLEHDPLFVRDSHGKEYLIGATAREVQILDLDSSLMVRTHPAAGSSTVSCFAVDAKDERSVHMAFSDGSIETWDWVANTSVQVKAPGKDVPKSIAAPATPDDQSTLIHLSDTTNHTAIYQGSELLHKVRHRLSSLAIFGQTQYIVAYGSSGLVLGQRTGAGITKKDFSWVELPTNAQPTCLDARLLPIVSEGQKKAMAVPGLSIAVGNNDGQIHLYDDVSSLFNAKDQPRMPSPRILHWHRNAVHSVKFSRDGIYLISGGSETVLVLWQLNTGRKQFLPHLTSTIERVVVNHDGDRYALHMGDNSIMVISTSELKPVANFAGLQMFPADHLRPLGRACTLHPRQPNQLLLTVPATNPASAGVSDRPFLQTFDTRSSRHITRQALTRNNVTDFNEGPESTPIYPPDVAHIAMSHDGQWLATVDEWLPPASDLMYLTRDPAVLQEERCKRREVYLKIWHWDEEQSLWSLATRADAPHARPGGELEGAGTVFTLLSTPTANGFVTVGEDSLVKFWKPKTRTRHGVALKDEQGREVVEWVCRRTVALPNDREESEEETFAPSSACAALSTDGSILAAAVVGFADDMHAIHFIDAASGDVMDSRSNLADSIYALGFIQRDLLIVSASAVYRWDVIDGAMKLKINFGGASADIEDPRRIVLAIDSEDNTFALATPTESGDKTKVVIHEAKKSNCIHEEYFDTSVEAMLTTTGSKGYTVVFGDATIRKLLPAGTQGAEAATGDQQSAFLQQSPDEMEAVAFEPMADLAGGIVRSLPEDVEDDRPVVRPEQLANIFDVGQSFAMPPVTDMFQAVVRLFGRPPIVAPQIVPA